MKVELPRMSSVSSDQGCKLICKTCGYQTLQKADLKLHDQAVHDGKQFHCLECEYQTNKKLQ